MKYLLFIPLMMLGIHISVGTFEMNPPGTKFPDSVEQKSTNLDSDKSSTELESEMCKKCSDSSAGKSIVLNNEQTQTAISQPVSPPNKTQITTTAITFTSTEPVSTTPEPVSTTLEPVSTTPESVSTTLEPVSTTPEPVSTTIEPVSNTPESTHKPRRVQYKQDTIVRQENTLSTTPVDDDVKAEHLRLEGNRYQGVVVHIGDDVTYNETLILNIQKLFNSSQEMLELATRPRWGCAEGLTFGSVIITVPSHWGENYPAPPVSLAPPSIRVEPPNPSHGHIPYTLQPGGCGEKGLYIHLTPEYVKNMFNEDAIKRIGSAGKVLVHEWAHLRWGAFDEYVTPDVLGRPHQALARAFYLDDKEQVRASACPLNMTGWIAEKVPGTSIKPSASLKQCESFTSKGLPAPNCFFYSDPEQQTNGSLMGYFSNSQLKSPGKGFCGNGEVPHDPTAPTAHNLKCGGRSVWEVMGEHEDFASHCGLDRRKPQITLPPNSLQKPTFEVYKRQNPKTLLMIMDCAQRSSDSTWLTIKQDWIRFLENFVPKDTKVLAATTLRLEKEPVDLALAIDGQQTGQELDTLTCDKNGTDTAAVAAAEQLTSESPAHSLVLVFTTLSSLDETLSDRVSALLPNNSALNTVSLGAACSAKSGGARRGRSSCTEHRNGDDLTETLRRVWAAHSAEEGLTQVYTMNHPLDTIAPGRRATMPSVSGNFFLNSCQGSSLVSVRVPTRVRGRSSGVADMLTLIHDGTKTNLSLFEPKLYPGAEKTTVVAKIPCDSAHGDWNYAIRTSPAPTPSTPTVPEGPAGTKQTIDVKVYQHEDNAVRIKTHILVKKLLSRNCNGQPSLDSSDHSTSAVFGKTCKSTIAGYVEPEHDHRKRRHESSTLLEKPKVEGGRKISYNDSLVRIVSVLTQGSKEGRTPVLGATVTAFVSREGSPNSLQVPLLDSGIDDDEIANDGIYSAILTGISGDGRYTVSVEATDGKSSRRKISTSRQEIFWAEHRSTSTHRSNLYQLKARCSGIHTGPTVAVQQQSEGSDSTPSLLVNLTSQDSGGSSSGRVYSGEVRITHSGKLIVPEECYLFKVVNQGEGSLNSQASFSGSSAPVYILVDDPRATFGSKASSTFPRGSRFDKKSLKDQGGNNDGSGDNNENDDKNKEDLELTAETSKFSLKEDVVKIEVVAYTSRDILPPGRVRNLTVTKIHYTRPAVTLEWTSPGDDFYSGTAHRLDLRYHHNREVLRVEFPSATAVVEEEHVPPGALKPLPASEKQSITVILEEREFGMEDLTDDVTLHFGLVVWDEANNAGELSNLAEARFNVIERDNERKEIGASQKLLSVAFSILMAALGVVIILVGAAKIKDYFLMKRKKADFYDVSYGDLTSITKFGTNPRNRGHESSTDSGGHGGSSRNKLKERPNGGKHDGALQDSSTPVYCSREPKGKQINYYGTT